MRKQHSKLYSQEGYRIAMMDYTFGCVCIHGDETPIRTEQWFLLYILCWDNFLSLSSIVGAVELP
jgi:hypothetical protein